MPAGKAPRPSEERRLEAGRFLGTSKHVYESSGLQLCEAFYRPERLALHSHENAHFCLVLTGSYWEQIEGEQHDRRPGNLIYYPPDTLHAETHLEGGRHFLVEVGSGHLNRARDLGLRLDAPTDQVSGRARWLVRHLYQEFQVRDGASPLAVEGIVLELLAETSRRTVPTGTRGAPPWLPRVIEMLRAGFVRPPRLERLAAEAGVHPVHLARVFRRCLGSSVGDFVRKERVDFARRELESARRGLAEIALAAGYCDQSHFTRSFKRETGLTPKEYRALFRG